jgi:hypothetical protein
VQVSKAAVRNAEIFFMMMISLMTRFKMIRFNS